MVPASRARRRTAAVVRPPGRPGAATPDGPDEPDELDDPVAPPAPVGPSPGAEEGGSAVCGGSLTRPR
ncbi:hypothetical protein GCM10022244_54530 [Streptomyces gulbargensis]|uniref:Uncharacterized protein n=1 Tax=Streptomyces gulbargensis TaxID=364901 RepID=A0ABP7N7Y8_9ACTN